MILSNKAKTSHPSPLQNSDRVIQSAGSEDSNDGCKGRGKYLGIDFGKAKIGLAVADGETKIAFALTTLANDKDFLPTLGKIIKDNEIGKIIIGIPAYKNRENIEYESIEFGKMLERELNIKVEYQNEMFTTKMAEDNLIEKGAKNIKNLDDKEAARIILQSWVDKKS